MLKWLPTHLLALFISAVVLSVLFLTPAPSFSAQATLAWDPSVPTPQGYRIYQRTLGGSYNYNNPVWTGSGTSGTVSNLTEGTRYYFVVRSYNSSQVSANSNEVSFISSSTSGSTDTGSTNTGSSGGQQPFKGTPWTIPGTIEAENYDTGGKGTAYLDKSSGNAGKAYRQDDVDIWNGGGTAGYFTGANASGEWLEYTVNVKASGTYSLDLNVATPNSGRKMRVSVDGTDVSGSISIPSTGGWGKWNTVMKTVQLSAGQHVLRVAFDIGGLNFDSIEVNPIGSNNTSSASTGSTSTVGTSTATNTGTSSGGQQPFKGTPWTIPGTIEAEDYDTGGKGTAYLDKTTGNAGKAYRQDDVDIWKSSNAQVGSYTGANANGEWLEYTVNVKAAGTYSLDLYVATPNNGRKMRVLANGKDITGPISIPNTGGWGKWDTVMKTVKLSAGKQVIRVVFDAGGLNFNWMDIDPIGN